MDIAGGNDLNKPIVSLMTGKGYGYLVIINHGNGVTTRYGHMSKKGIPAGTTVKAGQQIGTMDNTGHSYGVHLHFEVRINGEAVDPMGYVKDFSTKVNN
ncbi:M23 family metallopeptidase [Domibacillus sp. A3M-37]|uniref:M23 family metallopeptidase n=1 Tax=Domibacillus sp. A3M-37 TaxID=2962037 RepID=UPI002812639C|nr:M23 family metallopeptidase [Domibacillus sp. A3M-37]